VKTLEALSRRPPMPVATGWSLTELGQFIGRAVKRQRGEFRIADIE
jgi:hypothetical protein